MAKKPSKKKAAPLQSAGPTESASSQIVPVLVSYKQEADNARKGGLNPRDQKWEENLDLYWNRTDVSRKAAWQARENLPVVSNHVDRFAAALKDALVSAPEGFYTVEDPADTEYDITDAIKSMTDVWLGMCGKNVLGQPLDFTAVFEEQVKMGAMMALCSEVTWKTDVPGGRVSIDTIDPRKVWLDHTGRNLYRLKQKEMDKNELVDLAKRMTGDGRPVYNLEAIAALQQNIAMDAQREREQAAGHGNSQSSTRVPITIDEYIATVVGPGGEVLAKDQYMVVADDKHLIRGPEKNPFMHGKDWLVYCPLVTTPLSVYGRTYMEDVGALSRVFNNLTNLILDAVQVSALKVWAIVPSMLTNPEALNSGIFPNKVFQLEDGVDPKLFMNALDMGMLPPEAIQVWQAMKNELREAMDTNEIGLGGFAPKGRTSATEVSTTMESSSALIRSVAQTVEARWLNPTLDLTWKTGLQFAKKNDPVLMRAVGEAGAEGSGDLYNALIGRKSELLTRPVTFRAQGISMLIQKKQMIQNVIQLTQYLASNDMLLQAFMQQVDMEKFIKLLFHLSNVNLSKMAVSERQKLMMAAAQPMQQAAQAAGERSGPPGEGGKTQQEAGDVARAMGVQRQ